MAATEAAFVFPILLTLLMGLFDMGYGVLAAQKTIRASQVTADLIARHRQVTDSDIDEAIEAGMLSLVPFPTNVDYGVDVVSVRFDEDSDPQSLWCETRNMGPNETALDSLDGLGGPGEGLVVVTVQYLFHPVFVGFVVNDLMFQEVSYVRGRLTSTVPHEGGVQCSR